MPFIMVKDDANVLFYFLVNDFGEHTRIRDGLEETRH